MGKQTDNKASGEVNSRILLMILDELRYIRNRMDTALGAGDAAIVPPPSASQSPATPPKVEEAVAEVKIIEEEVPEVEIIEAEIVDEQEVEPPPPPVPKAKKQSAPARQPAKAATKTKPNAQPKTDTTGPQQPQNTENFNLPAPTSPDEEAKLFAAQKQRIENMMSVAQFTRAEKLAQALLAAVPDSDEAETLLETVRRESSAFRTEQQSRLFAEFQRWTESRQWVKAMGVGEQLVEQYPASAEAQKVAGSMSTVRKNAHFEEARSLRDRIRDLIKRKRYSEAVDVSEDLMRRFPNTQVAKQLKSLLPDLKRRSAHFR